MERVYIPKGNPKWSGGPVGLRDLSLGLSLVGDVQLFAHSNPKPETLNPKPKKANWRMNAVLNDFS